MKTCLSKSVRREKNPRTKRRGECQDFNLRQRNAVAGQVTAASYLGGRIAIATGSNSDVGSLLTAGVDVPIANRFTATGAVHAGFFDRTSVGLVIGAGYNF